MQEETKGNFSWAPWEQENKKQEKKTKVMDKELPEEIEEFDETSGTALTVTTRKKKSEWEPLKLCHSDANRETDKVTFCSVPCQGVYLIQGKKSFYNLKASKIY